jgi:hypothetical protein
VEDGRFMTEEYRLYLESNHWKELRRKRLEVAQYKCEKCKSPFSLQVHHIRYRNLYDVEVGDLICLCDYCHQKHHGLTPSYRPFSPRLKVSTNEYWKKIRAADNALSRFDSQIKPLKRKLLVAKTDRSFWTITGEIERIKDNLERRIREADEVRQSVRGAMV